MILTHRSLVAAVVTLTLVASSAQAQAPTHLIPSDADAVVYVNVTQLKDTKLVQKYAMTQVKEALNNSKEAQQFFTAIGLDPMKDISAVFVTNTGTSGKQFLLAVQGNFNTQRIDRAMSAWAKNEPDKVAITKMGTTNLIEIKEGNTPAYAALLDGKTMVASPVKAYVTSAIKGARAKPSKTLQRALMSASAKNQSVWMAGLIPEEARQMLAGQPGLAPLAKKLVAFSGSALVKNDVAASIQIHTTDANTARVLQMTLDRLKGLLTLVAMGDSPAAPVVRDVMGTLRVASVKASVGVSFKLSESSIETLEKLATDAK